MITKLSHSVVWVLDQDEALDFYTSKLGFTVNTDARMDSFRWLTVSPPRQPDFQIILGYPGPPMLDPESGEAIKRILEKGALGGGVLMTDDCRRAYEELRAKGVNFLQEPMQRDYGLEATFRDNSGTWFSLTERPS